MLKYSKFIFGGFIVIFSAVIIGAEIQTQKDLNDYKTGKWRYTSTSQDTEKKTSHKKELILGESFLSSKVTTPIAMNAFPYGEFSVSQLVEKLKNKKLANGKTPEILGWEKNDNSYTLKVRMISSGHMIDIQLVFTHLLNKKGLYSEIYGVINGEVIEGHKIIQLMF